MLRSLQFHEYEMIIAIVFLHYPDLQNRQLPPGMWFLHFGRDMAQGNQEPGLPASPTDRHVRPGTGKGRRERNATSSYSYQEEAPLLRGGPEAQAECVIMHTPGLQKPPMLGPFHHAAAWQV